MQLGLRIQHKVSCSVIFWSVTRYLVSSVRYLTNAMYGVQCAEE